MQNGDDGGGPARLRARDGPAPARPGARARRDRPRLRDEPVADARGRFALRQVRLLFLLSRVWSLVG